MELRIDKGALLENQVFTEIHKALPFQASLKFWRSRSGAEVDFVIEFAGKIFGLEVKSASLKRPAVGRSSRSFLDAYHPDQFAILNMTLCKAVDIGGDEVNFITPGVLPEWVESLFYQ